MRKGVKIEQAIGGAGVTKQMPTGLLGKKAAHA